MDDEIEELLRMFGMFFDKNGRPITLMQMAGLSEDPEYRTVGHWLSDDENWRVSTVWMGQDLALFMQGPPMIFETMAFWEGAGTSRHSQECVRYQTLAEAEHGHEQTVKCLKEARAPFDWVEKPYDWL